MGLWLVTNDDPRTKWDEFIVSAPDADEAESRAMNFKRGWTVDNMVSVQLAQLMVVDTDNLDGWRFRVQVGTSPVTTVTEIASADTGIDEVGQALADSLNLSDFISTAHYDVNLHRLIIAEPPDGIGDLEVRSDVRPSAAQESAGYSTTGVVGEIKHQGDALGRLGIQFELDTFLYQV